MKPKSVHKHVSKRTCRHSRVRKSKSNPIIAKMKTPFGVHSLLDGLVFADIAFKAYSESHAMVVVTGVGLVWAFMRIILIFSDVAPE